MASIQYFVTTKVKDDVTDTSISMSVLILSGMNADFDGDGKASPLNLPNCGNETVIKTTTPLLEAKACSILARVMIHASKVKACGYRFNRRNEAAKDC